MPSSKMTGNCLETGDQDVIRYAAGFVGEAFGQRYLVGHLDLPEQGRLDGRFGNSPH